MSHPLVVPVDLRSLPDLERCDPGGLLRRVFRGERTLVGARELVLVWLLQLPAELDPALAARHILATQPAVAQPVAAELSALLGEVARWPRARLAQQRLQGRCRFH